MNRLLSLSRADKILLLECDPPAENLSERMFLVGSYLLVKGSRTYITLSGAEVDCEWFPEYEIGIGGYLGDIPSDIDDLYVPSWGVYRRDYDDGFVLVNPTETARQIADLGGSFGLVSASGGGAVPENGLPAGNLSVSPVTALTLSAHAAAVLIRELDADLNDDGVVDSRDFGILLSSWGGVGGPADLDQDGDVDRDDADLLIAQWSE